MANQENGQRKIEFRKGTIIVVGLIGLLAIAVLANRLYRGREEGIDTGIEPQSLADLDQTPVEPEVAEPTTRPAGQLTDSRYTDPSGGSWICETLQPGEYPEDVFYGMGESRIEQEALRHLVIWLDGTPQILEHLDASEYTRMPPGVNLCRVDRPLNQ